MTWEPELEELRRREELARRMGGDERVERQHRSGRLTVRERIDRLFGPGTFHETGAIAGAYSAATDSSNSLEVRWDTSNPPWPALQERGPCGAVARR